MIQVTSGERALLRFVFLRGLACPSALCTPFHHVSACRGVFASLGCRRADPEVVRNLRFVVMRGSMLFTLGARRRGAESFRARPRVAGYKRHSVAMCAARAHQTLHAASFAVGGQAALPCRLRQAFDRTDPLKSDPTFDMTTRIASCSCGRLTATASGEPTRVSICHCLACQRRTGSVLAAQARFPTDRVQVAGTSSEYVRVGDEGSHCTYHFCPHCGATVYYSIEEQPGLVAIPVGAFAEPGFPAPTVSVYEARMHSWIGLPANIEHLA